jgi:hypothetical protein
VTYCEKNRAINKLGLAQEVRKQKLSEAQQLSEVVLDAEVKLGELISQIPKQPRIENIRSDSTVHSAKPKHEVIAGLGFNTKQAERFETLAAHPDIVEQAKNL